MYESVRDGCQYKIIIGLKMGWTYHVCDELSERRKFSQVMRT